MFDGAGSGKRARTGRAARPEMHFGDTERAFPSDPAIERQLLAMRPSARAKILRLAYWVSGKNAGRKSFRAASPESRGKKSRGAGVTAPAAR